MKHFFRAVEDGRFFKMFSPVHLVILGVFILGIYLLFHFRKQIKENYSFLGKILGTLLILDQVAFYTWQIASGYFNLRESLPLFHCRQAALVLGIGLLFSFRPAQVLGVFWGLMGSVLALLFTDMYPFTYPHFTNFQFFHLHMVMGWAVSYILFTKDYKFTPGAMKKVLLYTAFYNVVLFIFNTWMTKGTGLDYNYGFLRHLPLGLMKYLDWLPSILFPVLVIIAFSLVLYLIYLLILFVERKVK